MAKKQGKNFFISFFVFLAVLYLVVSAAVEDISFPVKYCGAEIVADIIAISLCLSIAVCGLTDW
jgi:hypothetical protein